MNLWIRSQDKLNLKKIDFILVNGLDLFCSDDLLGTYKTKERALEILNEIQELMLKKEQYIYNLTNCFEFLKSGHYSNLPINIKISSDNIVYEMPEE